MNTLFTRLVTLAGELRQNGIRKIHVMTTGIGKAVHFLTSNLEAFTWIAAIVYFAITPVHTGEHFTICPLNLSGFEHCPGCGLGRSIILLLHGHISESLQMHPLAIFALIVLIFRIMTVFRNYQQYQKHLTMNER